MKYALGFCFDEELERVVLIRKNKPEWQKGRLNGVGGKVEPGEHPRHAMVREFYEETGVELASAAWILFDIQYFESGAAVYFYYAVNTLATDCVKTMTDEEVIVLRLNEMLQLSQIIPNLAYLIPMALAKFSTIPKEFHPIIIER